MKKSASTSKAVVCLSILTAVNITKVNFAQAEVSYNAGIVSQYLWRGLDLNGEKSAIQGGADYAHSSGFYAGAWASQYDFGNNDDGIEIDIYGGYSLDLSAAFWLDFSVTNYQYTGPSDASIEWKIGLAHEFFQVNYHHDQDLVTDYLELNSSYPLNERWGVNGHVGNNDDGDESYFDYAIFATYLVNDNFQLSGGYSDHELAEKGAEGTFYLGLYSSF